MKKTLFLSAILGAALCSSAYADTTTITVDGKQYTKTVVLTTTPVDQPTDEFTNVLFAKGSDQDMKVQNRSDNAWVTTLDNTKTLIAAPATDGSTTYNGARLWFDTGDNGNIVVNANIIAGGTSGSELRFWSKQESDYHTILKGDITVAGDGLQIWQHHGTQYIEGALNAAGKNVTITGGETASMLNLSGGASIGTLDTTANSASVTLCSTNFAGEAAKSTTYTIGNVIGNKLTVGAGTTLTITGGIDGKVTNNGTLNFSGTVNVTAATGTDENITEGVNAFSSMLYTRDIATTGGTISADGVTWTFNGKTATDVTFSDGTISGRAESTKYYVNAGGNVNYTPDITDLIVNQAATVNIASGDVLQQTHLTANAATTLTGSGTYEVNGWANMGAAAPGNMLTNVTLSGSDLTLSIVGGSFKDIDLDSDKFGSATVEVKGITGGYIKTWQNGTLNRNIKLTNNGGNAAWVWTDGKKDTETIQTFAGTWSGTGNFIKNADERKEGFTWTGDISQWTGQLRIISNTDTTLTFGGSANAINVREIRKEHTGVLNINFTSDQNMTVANSIVKDGGTIVINANANVSFGKAVAADTMMVAAGKTVTLGNIRHTIGTLTINGTVETSKNGNANGFVSGDVTVNAGGTLSVVDGGQDALGWGDSATSSLTLLGSEDAKATLGLNYNGTGSLTLKTNLNMSGHSQVNGTRSFNTHEGVITATGKDNIISAGMVLRKAASIVVEDGGELLISGTVSSSDQTDGTYSLTKTGNGLLTIRGNIAGSSEHKATITGDGANTVIASDTIGYAKLQNTTLSSAAHTFTGTGELKNVSATLEAHIGLQGDLTLSGGTAITMTSNWSGHGVWLDTGKTLTIDSDSSLSVAEDLALTAISNTLNATVTGTGETNQIGTHTSYHDTVNIENAAITVLGGTVRNYNISGGSVTVGNDKTVTVNSTLSGTTALVLGSGSSVSFGQDSSVASVSGADATVLLNHNLTVTGDAATFGSLTLSNGADITVNEHNGTLTTTTLIVANAGSEMNANLVVTDNGTMDFSAQAVLTMGCTVSIGDNVTVVLNSTEIYAIQHGTQLVLIDGVDGVSLEEAITIGSGILFVDENGASLNHFGLALQGVESGTEHGSYAVVVTPEPATATLSLLALAALASRRRRH